MLQALRHAAGEFHTGARADNTGYSTHARQFNSVRPANIAAAAR
jgi:hypothetical protein